MTLDDDLATAVRDAVEAQYCADCNNRDADGWEFEVAPFEPGPGSLGRRMLSTKTASWSAPCKYPTTTLEAFPMIITLPYAYLRAVFANVGNDRLSRRRLRRVRIERNDDGNTATLVASNGAAMTWCTAQITDDTETPPSRSLPIKLPERADAATLQVSLDTAAGRLSYQSRGVERTFSLEVTPAAEKTGLANWRRVADSPSWKAAPVSQIGIDFALMGRIAEALNSPSKLSFADEHSAIKVDWLAPHCADIHSVLMPVRL